MGVRRQVLRDEVQEMILERLLESRWAPGSRLSIDGLARELDVSPTPIREALVSLERSGLVEYAALRGYIVSPLLDGEAIRELIDARVVIESAALSRAFARWELLCERLQEAHSAHIAVLDDGDDGGLPDYRRVSEHFQADWHFHHVIFEIAGNRYLAGTLDILRPHTHRMRQAWSAGDEPEGLDMADAIYEHQLILDRVLQRNHDGSLSALQSHLAGVRRRSLASSHE